MLSSVIPARLEFQCGHAALVSLPRIKGETSAQRAARVAREKSAAQTRACDFCAQRLEVVVQAAPAAPRPMATASEPPTPATPPPSVAPAPSAVTPAESSGALIKDRPSQPTNGGAAVKRVEPTAAAARPTETASIPNRPVSRRRRNGKAASGVRFTVEFQVQTVLRAADLTDALRQAQSLGAIEVLTITREN